MHNHWIREDPTISPLMLFTIAMLTACATGLSLYSYLTTTLGFIPGSIVFFLIAPFFSAFWTAILDWTAK